MGTKPHKVLIAAGIGTILSAGLVTVVHSQADADAELLATLIDEGDGVYHSVGCSSCHGDEGQGGVGPEFVGNELLESRTAVVSQIMDPDEEHGQMPAFAHLSDREIAAVATYIRNSWGNAHGILPESSVALFRAGMEGGSD